MSSAYLSVILPIYTSRTLKHHYMVTHGLTYNARSGPSAFVPHLSLFTSKDLEGQSKAKTPQQHRGETGNARYLAHTGAGLEMKKERLSQHQPRPLAMAEPPRPTCWDLAGRWQCRTGDQGLWPMHAPEDRTELSYG